MSAFSHFPGARYLSRRFLARLALGLAVAYVALVLVMMGIEDRLVFHPHSPARRWAKPTAELGARDVYLRTADGTKVHALWFPCRRARGAVLICHTRSGNVSSAVFPDAVRRWHGEIGASVLVFDYPGYGRSEGQPSEAGCYAAADAAYDWLTRTQGIAPEQLLLLGRSLGTAVAVDLAARRPHRALILISPFTSLPDVGHRLCPVLPTQTLMRNRFDSLSRIRHCTRPLLVFHGTRDSLIPLALGKRLFADAPGPKRLVRVRGAGHDDAVTANFFPELRRFLADEVAGENGAAALAGVARGPTISKEAPLGGSDECDPDPTDNPRTQRHRR